MEEFMQMLEELFKRMAGRNGKGEGGDENQAGTPEAPGRMPRIKRACASVLAGMKREIHVLEQGIAGLDARRDALIEEYNALVAEIKTMEAECQPLKPPAPEEEQHGSSAQPEQQPPEPENPRLAALEQGVKTAIKILGKAPMAKRFKSMKRLLKSLVAAMDAAPGLTENERIALLEVTIGDALNYLQTAKMTVRSTTLKEIKKVLEETIDKKNQIQE